MRPDHRAEDIIDIALGAERSRALAWAKYFEVKADNEKLLDINYRLQVQVAELCVLVAQNECLNLLDQESKLVRATLSILGSLRRRKRGSAAIKEALAKHKEEEAA